MQAKYKWAFVLEFGEKQLKKARKFYECNSGFSFLTMTVLQVIQHYEKAHGHHFSVWHKKVVGGIIKKQFLLTQSGVAWIVPSVEPHGMFHVLDYPNTFLSRMEGIVEAFAEQIRLQKEEKAKEISRRIAEKPAPKKQQKQIKTVPVSSPPKRKRIPIKTPAFSGNRFKQ